MGTTAHRAAGTQLPLLLAASQVSQRAAVPDLTCRVFCCCRLPQDETTRYRAVMRSQNLFNKSHSVSHNIITGEPRRAPPVVLPEP